MEFVRLLLFLKSQWQFMYTVNGHGKQYDDGTGFVRWAHKLESLRVNPIYIHI